jgi:hypothetical protein
MFHSGDHGMLRIFSLAFIAGLAAAAAASGHYLWSLVIIFSSWLMLKLFEFAFFAAKRFFIGFFEGYGVRASGLFRNRRDIS